MNHALTTRVFVRCDDGLLTPATVISPAMGLADLPALGRYYEVRSQHRTFVVNDRRIAPAGKPRSFSGRPNSNAHIVFPQGTR